MNEEQLQVIDAALSSFRALSKHKGYPPLEVVYRRVEGFPKPEENAEERKIVREVLSDHICLVGCVKVLLQTYPDVEFTAEQVMQCCHIFRQIVISCTYLDMPNDEVVEFAYESYYPAGHFSIPRSKVAQDILNAPSVRVLCFDIGKSDEGPGYTLLELLTNEEAYNAFLVFWEHLPRYDFTAEQGIEDLEVNIKRVDRSMEETEKMNKKMLEGMQKIETSFRGFTGEVMDKTEKLRDLALKKQSEQIEGLTKHVRFVEAAHKKTVEVVNQKVLALAAKHRKQLNHLQQQMEEAERGEKKALKRAKKARKKEKKLRKKLKERSNKK